MTCMLDYVQRRQVHANVHNDSQVLTEVNSLVNEVKDARAQIPPEVRHNK